MKGRKIPGMVLLKSPSYLGRIGPKQGNVLEGTSGKRNGFLGKEARRLASSRTGQKK